MDWIDMRPNKEFLDSARSYPPEPSGIHKVNRYGVETFEDTEADEMRRERCLCRHCARLRPGERDNCTAAATLFAISTTKGFAACVTRCADFVAK